MSQLERLREYQADARRKANAKGTWTFIDISIPRDAKNVLKEWEPDAATISRFVQDLAARGTNLKLAYNERNGNYTASATRPSQDRASVGCSVSSWGADPLQALAGLLYKWYVILDGDLDLPLDDGEDEMG